MESGHSRTEHGTDVIGKRLFVLLLPFYVERLAQASPPLDVKRLPLLFPIAQAAGAEWAIFKPGVLQSPGEGAPC